MKTSYLLPNKYKTIGWILFIFGILSGCYIYLSDYESSLLSINVLAIFNENYMHDTRSLFRIIENDIVDELTSISIILGGLIIGFSKEKVEDEFIYKLRHDSLVWAILINYVILLFAVVFVYNMTFFDVLVFNMFTPLIIFIIRFNFLKLKSQSHEE